MNNDRNADEVAFTLIELSIALVIIGLIIAGILVGKDLITASEVRTQISQIEKYQTAVNTFRVKYGALPGDMKSSDAVSFGFSARGTVAGQGNGDGIIEGHYMGANAGWFIAAGETAIFWRDLSDAKLIDGSFTDADYDYATICSGSPMTADQINKRYPSAKIQKNSYVYVWSGGWKVINTGINDRVNYFAISQVIDPCYPSAMDVSITPNQAYAIDKKTDDGLPQSGRVMAMYPTNGATDAFAMWQNLWAAGGVSYVGGQGNGGGCDNANFCGPVTASAAPAVIADAQTDYSNGYIDCFDNRGVSNATMQYSTQFMGGNNQSCALSFKFQ